MTGEASMAETTTVPITIEPEAAARVAELGMQRELEEMLAHAQQTVPNLRALEVQLALPYDTGDETSLTIQATIRGDHPDGLNTRKQWGKWLVRAYSPDVWRYFVLQVVYGNNDGR
jgi:hypothetical protein